MNSFRLTLGAVVLAALLVPRTESAQPDSPGSLVEWFYTVYLRSWRGGLPAGDELRALRPFFSEELNRAIGSALRYKEQYIASHPDATSSSGPPTIYKPPFADGDYFTGFEEGAKSFQVRETASQGRGRWKVRVHFWYDRALSGWDAGVIVKEERGRYVIDDVVFSDYERAGGSIRLSDSLRMREYE